MPPRLQLLQRSCCSLTLPIRESQSTRRTFSTTSVSRKDTGSHLPKHLIPKTASIPPYPYKPALTFKQSDRGLYGGQTIQFGNNVSPDSETKTRRYWMPNVLNKSLYSVALNKKVKLRITSKVLKTMDREGGLDEYLLKQTEKRVQELGPIGWNLRWLLMQQPSIIARMRAEAEALGLSQETIDKEWPLTPASKQKRLERTQQLEGELAQLEAEYERDDAEFEDQTEAKRIQRVGNRYFKMGWAASKEEGVQLAVERADFRQAKREKSAKNYERHLEEVEKAGGIEAWRALRKEEIAQAGGHEAWLAAKREKGKQEWELSQAQAQPYSETPVTAA